MQDMLQAVTLRRQMSCSTGAWFMLHSSHSDDQTLLLCCSEADTEAKNLDGKTALEVAELNKQDGVVALLKQGASDAKPADEK